MRSAWLTRQWLNYEDHIARLDAECTYPVEDPEYDSVGSEPSLSHSFGELVGPVRRPLLRFQPLYGATAEGDWYDIDSNSIINETHERYGDEESGWQLSKPNPAKRYVPYKTVHGPVNHRKESK